MKQFVLVFAALISGCAMFERKPVNIPIPVACVKEKPVKPGLATDADLVKMTDGQLVLTLGRDRLVAAGYIGELEAVVDGCSKLQ